MKRWTISILIAVSALCSWADSVRVEQCIELMSSGDFQQAEERLRLYLQDDAVCRTNQFTQAAAQKWLAQALASQGREKHDEAMDWLDKAQQNLTGLETLEHPDAALETGRVLLVKAQLLCLDAIRTLQNLRLTGTEPGEFFNLLNRCVVPAGDALREAGKYYPVDQMADVYLAEADLAGLTLNLNRMFFPERDLSENIRRVQEYYQKAVEAEERCGEKRRADVVASGWIGIGTLLRESTGRNSIESDSRSAESAVAAFSKALESNTRHRELFLTAAVGKAKSILNAYDGRPLPDVVAKEMEELLLQAADGYEEMRMHYAGSPVLQESASFFSSRTAVYETLLLFYEKTGHFEKMFLAVEQMKARAFRDILRSGEIAPEGFDSSLDVKKLSGRLKSQNAALIEFFYGPETAWVFYLPPDGSLHVRRLDMSGQELTRKISVVLKGFSDQMTLRLHVRSMRRGSAHPAMTQAYAAAAELYRELIEPIEDDLTESGAELLYIVPHHAMHYLPFQALVVEQNETNLLQCRYYIETGRALAYLPSAAALLDIPEPLKAQGSMVFARSDFTSQMPIYPNNLPNAVPEARMAADILGVEPFLKSNATEERLRAAEDSHSILYFATHGDLKSDRPLDSSLLLAASSPQPETSCDGFLTVREILSELRGKMRAELVILSACYTNRGEPNPYSGDDISNLSRAFLAAGSRSVVATQWEASDDTFPHIMEFFLRALAPANQPQMGKARALTAAIRNFLLQEDLGVYRHPLFWAPVVLLGDGDHPVSF